MTQYLTNDTELTSIADAIRTKGGTSAPLAYPAGFVSAIENIPTGGGEPDLSDFIANHDTWTSYENFSASRVASRTFAYCINLSTVIFHACESICENAFEHCGHLTNADFPACAIIGYGAFSYCNRLSSINFPVCITIGDYAFYSCSSITTANFPKCTTIGSSVFRGCNLITASFSECTSIVKSMFELCSNLTSVSFPACTNIGGYAFQYCSNLASVSFPACTNIGGYAFQYCMKLLSLYLLGTSFVSLANSNAFNTTPIAGYTTLTGGVYGSIYVPASMLESYKTMTNWAYFSDRFVGV